MSACGYDVFVIKLNAAGVWQWSRQRGTYSDDYAYALSLGAAGHVYIAGYTEGDFDGRTNAGGYDVFEMKFNAAGV